MHTSHTITLPGHPPLVLGQTPLVMGILNVTQGSFSDRDQNDLGTSALAYAQQMIAEGVDIIDIGWDSVRSGAVPVGVQEELDRVLPLIDALAAAGITTPICINTCEPLVADQAIQAGAVIISDGHGLHGAPEMVDVAATYGAPVIATHWQQGRDRAVSLVEDMRRYFDAAILRAEQAGLSRQRLVFDPGFGLGKSLADDDELLSGFLAACPQNSPILIGMSRQLTTGGVVKNDTDGTVAGYINGGHIFRVHQVRANRDALRVAQTALYGLSALS